MKSRRLLRISRAWLVVLRSLKSSPDPFFMKVKQLESESIIQSYHVFPVTAATKELDLRLRNILTSLQFDTEGRLVQSLKPKDLFKVFEPTFTSFFNEWMENSKSSYCSKSH